MAHHSVIHEGRAVKGEFPMSALPAFDYNPPPRATLPPPVSGFT